MLGEGGGDGPLEVRAAPGLVGEDVDDRKRRGAGANGEPRDRGRLRLDQRQRALQEGGDVLLAAGLRLEPHDQTGGDHAAASSPSACSSAPFGLAPIVNATGSPPSNRIMVGIDWTP